MELLYSGYINRPTRVLISYNATVTLLKVLESAISAHLLRERITTVIKYRC